MSAPDALADLLADSMRSVSPCFDHEVPDCGLCRTRRAMAAADAIRAALADGSLTPEDLGMELHDECTLSACEGTADPHHPLYRLPSKEVTDG